MVRLLLYGTGAFIVFLSLSTLANRRVGYDIEAQILAVVFLFGVFLFVVDDLFHIWRRRIKKSAEDK